LDLQNEFDEIEIQFNSEHLREGSAADFLTKLKEFDPIYDKIKEDQNVCVRYIGNYRETCKMTKFWK
jgi:hypothetical protein